MSIIEKSRRKSVFGGGSETAGSAVQYSDDELNPSAEEEQRQSETVALRDPAAEYRNKEEET